MRASAAAHDFAVLSLRSQTYAWQSSSPHTTPKWRRDGRAGRLKQVFGRIGLTMAQVSALTGMRYGKKTPYFIPPTFFFRQKQGITPHICQIVALSQITGYRFTDWMNLCGFDLKLILALQLRIHTERTAIVTPAHKFPAQDPTL